MKQQTFPSVLGVTLLGVVFASVVFYLTSAYPAGDWRLLLIPVPILAGLFFFIKGTSDRVTKLVTLAIALGIILLEAFFASLVDDWYDLMTPVLLLAGLFFFVKIMSERQTKHVADEKKVWMREELLFGVLLGLVLVVHYAFSVRIPPGIGPDPTTTGFFIFIVPSLLCGIAGFIGSQRNRTVEAGIEAGTLTAVIGVLLLFVSRPLVIALFWQTVRSFYPVPPDQSMWNSPGIWGDQLDGGPSVLLALLIPSIFAGAIGSGMARGMLFPSVKKEGQTQG